MKIGIVGFFMASLQVAFIVMKLCGAISWSWWLVMLPILCVVVMNILAILLVLSVKIHRSRQLIKQYGTDNPLAIRVKKMQQVKEEFEQKMKERT